MRPSCTCCSGIDRITPVAIANGPGRRSLAYRVGTHGQFLATMRARLSSPDLAQLRRLAARDGSDPAIALLDGWAVVGDVLTFYQERIANEGYLRTATERRSIGELGRLVGWRLRPGLAATVYLAYTVDPDPQDPAEPPSEKDRILTIESRSKVQNVPGPGELPQTFETEEALEARAWWNDLRPRQTRPMRLLPADFERAVLPTLSFLGTALGIAPNDVLLLVFGDYRDVTEVVCVQSFEVDDVLGTTTVVVRCCGEPLAESAGAFAKRAGEVAELAAAEGANLKFISKDAIKQLVDRIAALAASGQSIEKFASEIRSVMNAFSAAYAEAKPSPFRKWLASVIDLLEPLTRDSFEAAGHADGDLAVPEPGGGTLDVATIVDRLKVAPSLPPASARALRRTVENQFAAGSDVSRKVLANLDPMLGSSLYKAMAEADTNVPNPLDEINAFRVKAQPFGVTAPLRPVLDSKGAVVGSEDWPLTGELSLELHDSGRGDIMEIEVIVRSADTSLNGVIDQDNPEIKLGDVRVGAPADTWQSIEIILTVDHGDTSRTIEIRHNGDRPEVVFSDDDGEVWRPPRGGTIRRSSDSIRRSVGLVVDSHTESSGLVIIDRLLLPPDRRIVLLDAEYAGIVPGSWVVIDRPLGTSNAALNPAVARVVASSTVAVARYGLTAKVTRLELDADWLDHDDLLLGAVRNAIVHAASSPVLLAEEPIQDCVPDDDTGTRIELGRLYPGLEAGRWVIVAGERCDLPGIRAAELAMIGGVQQSFDDSLPGDKLHTTLALAEPLSYRYVRSSVVVYGNVAKASHGETHDEVLGSGDPSQPRLTFKLRSKPLTFLPSAAEDGADPALEVRIDSLLWHDAPSLLDLGPTDRRYLLDVDHDDVPIVAFGTGARGARPASGRENIKARYRTGAGRSGNVPANRATQLMTRPLGVSAVTNPLAASGGADRESRDQARRNIPIAVQALDRLVSVVDYENFARARAGIGQASGRLLSDGRQTLVHLTIAGVDDAPIARTSDLYRALTLALCDAGDPSIPVMVDSRELAALVISAGVRIDPDRLWEDVEQRIRTAMLEAFGFESRGLGQDVLLSEVQATMQAVPGVVYVDVDSLAKIEASVDPATLDSLQLGLPANGRLVVPMARLDGATRHILPAQIALLNRTLPDTLILTEVRP